MRIPETDESGISWKTYIGWTEEDDDEKVKAINEILVKRGLGRFVRSSETRGSAGDGSTGRNG